MQTRGATNSVAMACAVGTTIEWYDFVIYGTASAFFLPKLFFPSVAPAAATLLSFSTFALAFIVRPIGALVFGHFGDRIGRKALLVVTIILMGTATTVIGLLPTYASIGVAAPLLLVLLRLLQGISISGEFGGAVLMAVEHSEPGRLGYHGSWVQMGAPAGVILANAGFLIITQLPESALLSWGWRIPFLLGSVLLVVGLCDPAPHLRVASVRGGEAARRYSERSRVGRAPRIRGSGAANGGCLCRHWRRVLRFEHIRTDLRSQQTRLQQVGSIVLRADWSGACIFCNAGVREAF